MSEPDSPDKGLLASVRRVADSLLALAQNRVELFAIEFQSERLRLLDRLFWLVIALSLTVIGMLLAAGTAALYLWQTEGYAGLIILSVVFLAIGGVLLLRLRAKIRKSPPPFSETIAEFKKDRSCLQRRN